MSESLDFETNDPIASIELEDIYAVRDQTDLEMITLVQDEIYEFNIDLKEKVTDAFGNTSLLQQVDSWQALVGGSVEPRIDITNEQFDFIDKKVKEFVIKLKERLARLD